MKYGYLLTHFWQTEAEKEAYIADLTQQKITALIEDDCPTQPHFQQLLTQLSSSDDLYVPSISALGTNFDDIKMNITSLAKKRVRLHILDAPFLEFNQYSDEVQTHLQTLFFQILDYITQYEKQKMKDKQRLGIELAKQRGSYKGRQKWYTDEGQNSEKRKIYQEIIEMLNSGTPIMQIHKATGVSRTTIYRIKDEYHRH